MITALDHLQLTAPPGSEQALRAFYTGALGMTEIPKPPQLDSKGGCWFTAGDGRIRLYLGIEGHFRPTTKAHPGLRVTDIDALAERLTAHGAEVVRDDSLPPHRRIYCQDPAGNLLEFLEPTA